MKVNRYKYLGRTVYGYSGCTYGCCTPDETPVTIHPDKTPFFGVPTVELVDDGVVDVETDDSNKSK